MNFGIKVRIKPLKSGKVIDADLFDLNRKDFYIFCSLKLSFEKGNFLKMLLIK